jgi:hypothetical protein
MLAPDKKTNRFESCSEVAQEIPIIQMLCHEIWWQYYGQCVLGLQGPLLLNMMPHKSTISSKSHLGIMRALHDKIK